MDNYISKYHTFNKTIVYNFKLEEGGISDCIKFFMILLESSMKNNTRLYYKKNNLEIEKYIKLHYDIMYIDNTLPNIEIITPYKFHLIRDFKFSIDIKEVFYFTDEIQVNCKKLFPENITNYISIHLRLGDKFLETDAKYVLCKNDIREFSEERLYRYIEENSNKNIFFCCDNNSYKMKIKEKYNNIIITNCDVGHTSFSNTTKNQVIDAITEFYILTKSETIFAASQSGFSLIASKFNNTPLILGY